MGLEVFEEGGNVPGFRMGLCRCGGEAFTSKRINGIRGRRLKMEEGCYHPGILKVYGNFTVTLQKPFKKKNPEERERGATLGKPQTAVGEAGAGAGNEAGDREGVMTCN